MTAAPRIRGASHPGRTRTTSGLLRRGRRAACAGGRDALLEQQLAELRRQHGLPEAVAHHLDDGATEDVNTDRAPRRGVRAAPPRATKGSRDLFVGGRARCWWSRRARATKTEDRERCALTSQSARRSSERLSLAAAAQTDSREKRPQVCAHFLTLSPLRTWDSRVIAHAIARRGEVSRPLRTVTDHAARRKRNSKQRSVSAAWHSDCARAPRQSVERSHTSQIPKAPNSRVESRRPYPLRSCNDPVTTSA